MLKLELEIGLKKTLASVSVRLHVRRRSAIVIKFTTGVPTVFNSLGEAHKRKDARKLMVNGCICFSVLWIFVCCSLRYILHVVLIFLLKSS